MFDAFAKVVSQSDVRGEYLTNAQLLALSAMVEEGSKRMDIVSRISGNASAIVSTAARELFIQEPGLIAPGGNAYPNRRVSACLRDMEVILRYITYAIYTGDASVLETRCLHGLRETYLALGVPGSAVAVGIQKMKVAAITAAKNPIGVTPGDCSDLIAEVAGYFDQAAAAVV